MATRFWPDIGCEKSQISAYFEWFLNVHLSGGTTVPFLTLCCMFPDPTAEALADFPLFPFTIFLFMHKVKHCLFVLFISHDRLCV